MQKQEFIILLDRYISGDMSKEEIKAFLPLLRREEYSGILQERMREDWAEEPEDIDGQEILGESITQSVLERIRATKEPSKRNILHYLRSWQAAAAIILILIGSLTFTFSRETASQKKEQPVSQSKNKEISPGQQGAILVLANGTRINLDTASNGSIALQAGKTLQKVNGSLKYTGSRLDEATTMYNTMSTPRGRQYSIVLEDGSRIWLNAGSSIRFPVMFPKDKRRVSITGEVYFEIAHEENRPFIAEVNDVEVTVLGTHFNINAYADEHAIKTTLLEGSVKIRRNNVSRTLQPEEQALTTGSNDLTLIKNVDVAAVIAWKEGFFNFNKSDIRTVMRQLARWYDVNVTYNGEPGNQLYWGSIPQNLPLSGVFKVLEESGANFRIEGKNVIVYP